MRDLARQNYSNSKIAISRKAIKFVVVLVFVIVIIFVVKKYKFWGEESDKSIILRDTAKGLTPVSLTGSGIDIGEGVDLAQDNATFKNVSDVSGSATAVRTYGDGSYSLSVSAKLPDPIDNEYQVWIVGGSTIKLAGSMSGAGTSWSLIFRDKDLYSKLNNVWITKEITNNDEKPEKHILEGNF